MSALFFDNLSLILILNLNIHYNKEKTPRKHPTCLKQAVTEREGRRLAQMAAGRGAAPSAEGPSTKGDSRRGFEGHDEVVVGAPPLGLGGFLALAAPI